MPGKPATTTPLTHMDAQDQPEQARNPHSDPSVTSTARSTSVDIDGAKLRELRKRNGDNLKTVAARAGITFQYLSQLELGVRRRVTPPTFARICHALGIEDQRELLLPQQPVQPPGAPRPAGRPTVRALAR